MTAPASGLIIAPGQHADDAQELIDLANHLLERAVVLERLAGTPWRRVGGAPWRRVGGALGGVTQSTAHGRFSDAVQGFHAGSGDETRRELAAADLDDAWTRIVTLAERRARRAEILRTAP